MSLVPYGCLLGTFLTINKMIIHENKSTVVIATFGSNNRKTGNMVQVWILEKDKSPVESVKTGSDAETVCKGCPFASGNGCYVNVGQAPNSVWKAYKRGSYGKADWDAFNGKAVRFGAYGNPSLIPLSIIEKITRRAEKWTGYFHDWKDMSVWKRFAYGSYFMASTETEKSRQLAVENNLRFFHVSPDKPKDAIECLADTLGISCADCGLCDGNNKENARSIWINPHGSKKRKAAEMAMGVNLLPN